MLKSTAVLYVPAARANNSIYRLVSILDLGCLTDRRERAHNAGVLMLHSAFGIATPQTCVALEGELSVGVGA
jgi:hypothetical protein